MTYTVHYEKNETSIQTVTFDADSVDCTGAPGWAIFWDSNYPSYPVKIFNKDHIVYIVRNN